MKIVKTVTVILLIIMVFSYIPNTGYINGYAASSASSVDKQKELRDSINEAVKMLEKKFAERYNNCIEDIKQEIKKNSYDYEMSMMSFYDNGNPFKKMDYTRLIAALSTVKEIAATDSSILNRHLLSDVDFLSYEMEKETLEDGKDMGNITLNIEDPEYVFEFFGINMDDTYKGRKVKSIYENKVKIIDTAVFGVKLNQNTFINTRYDESNTVLSELILKTVLASDLSTERKTLIRVAMSLIGQVPYQWGGKASKAGYDDSWWLYTSEGEQKGLDCSGYVQWAFMTAGFDKKTTDKLISTASTVGSFETISEDQLLPGDLGLFNDGSLSSNHIGIYLGDGYWIHCSSGKGTVTISENIGFNLFVRAIKTSDDERMVITEDEIIIDDEGNQTVINESEKIDEINLEEYEPVYEIGNDNKANEGDVYFLAQLMHHEAGNQGVNGLVAVAEVVMNRLKSSLFPNTLEEIIYQKNQFADNYEIDEIEPSDEEITLARDVMEGKISILGNENVLYFRNPTITSGIPASDNVNWDKHQWYMAVGAHAFYLQ